jgi:hypothetical protein
VASELTEFAEGRHPSYPGFCNPKYALGPSRLYGGRWVRRDSTRNDPSDDDKNETGQDRKEKGDDLDCYVYQLRTLQPHADAGDGDRGPDQREAGGGSLDPVVVADGDEQVLELLHDDCTTICGIQDDYEFWSGHRCRPWAGKPVWKLPPPAGGASVMPTIMAGNSTASCGDLQRDDDAVAYHHILFDDNIHNSSTDSVACVRVTASATETRTSGRPLERRARTFRTLSGVEALGEQGVHLVRVPTVEVAMKPTWFLEQVDRAVERYFFEDG